MTIPTHIWEAYWSEAKPGTEAALERVIAELERSPTAFRWTPEMRALWPDHMRPTMTGLLAIWEALQGAAEYYSSQDASEEVTAEDDGWVKWDGGHCPVERQINVQVKLRDGEECYGRGCEFYWLWGPTNNHEDIIAYRLAK